jgi:flagellar biosynthesis/type III secretory pathway chaperone
MRFFNSARPSVALKTLLEKERKALLKGDFKTLPQLIAPKENLLKALRRTPPTQNELEQLKAATERNAKLLSASARGLNRAKIRIANLRNNKNDLSTYGPSGEVTQMSKAWRKLQKTA